MKKPDAPVEEESTLDKIVGATAAKSLATGNRALMTEDMALQLAPGAFKKKRRRDSGAAPQARRGREGRQRVRGIGLFPRCRSRAIGGNHHDVGQRRADTSLADKSGTTPLMLAAAGE